MATTHEDHIAYTATRGSLDDTHLPICVKGHAEEFLDENPGVTTLTYNVDRETGLSVTGVTVDGEPRPGLDFAMHTSRMCGPYKPPAPRIVSSETLTREQALATPLSWNNSVQTVTAAFLAVHTVRVNHGEGDGMRDVVYLDVDGVSLNETLPLGGVFQYITAPDCIAAGVAPEEEAMRQVSINTWLRREFVAHPEYLDAIFKCIVSLETYPSRDTYNVLFRDAARDVVRTCTAQVSGF